jgi:hypothetical protein
MQDERNEELEGTEEEVEAHRRFGAEEAEDLENRDEQAGEDEDVEAHRFRYGSEEPGKHF